ncbi:MAG: tRNA (adenosine(37)-N6)-threonylcarbamoyltransferase complex ATPase subunit type 1 TsaE [Chloroflexi bacterium]|jgi:tRNA threonylcarbamoyladenosine biosynthesis protein TsaE|nr:tRNA (adenosine(37)-N6)-threonylcarbamoyltransferase complex ATPase subunit type 1 TsaE [Chloroflexota bacterium]MCH2524533.1 tRNA (adenosine(37)-N6)-threonylcarbamoyltransferase complex ATPase subunit type 1 TsaE [Dehalococcoidia bacterium]|tara:strand:- start:5636 stop:6124 length:489 start_codon:yes stop_codon:yes gene_type:complete
MSTANRFNFHTTNVRQTQSLAKKIAKLLLPGDVLLLQGPLGAGKTTFTQGLAKGMNIKSEVTSPTFILLAQHEPSSNNLALFHADLYRLTDPMEVMELHLEEQASDGVLIVEWPDRAPEMLPKDHLLISIALQKIDHNARTFTFVSAGERAREIVDGLQSQL